MTFSLSAQLTSLVIGILIGCIILFLVRKNHLLVSNAIWWLILAVASIILGAYNRLIDLIGSLFGVSYPPTLLLIFATGVILIKVLTMDLMQSEHERKIRSLAAKLAILENELRSGNYADAADSDIRDM